jgi:hypothetical protein
VSRNTKALRNFIQHIFYFSTAALMDILYRNLSLRDSTAYKIVGRPIFFLFFIDTWASILDLLLELRC